MKNIQRNLLLFPLVALLLLPGSEVPGAGEIRVTVRVDEGRVQLARAADGDVVSVDPRGGENWADLADAGRPELPYRIVTVALPPGHVFESVSVGSRGIVSLSSEVRVRLAQPPRPEPSDRSPGAGTPPSMTAAGSSETRFPAERVRYLGTGYLHGRALASFAVFPFEIDGSVLRLHTDLLLEIASRPGAPPVDVTRPQRMSGERAAGIDRDLQRLVENDRALAAYPGPALAEHHRSGFRPTEAPSLEGSPVDYVIISPAALAGTWQRLADWRTAAGLPTVVRTVEWIEANTRRGSDLQETLRNFIKDAYQKWGTKFVLLGADTGGIPARICFSTFFYGGTYIPVDVYYGGLDGTWNEDHDAVWGEQPDDFTDLYAEVFVTRLTAETVSDADVFIDKIISYETPLDATAADRALFLSEVLSPTPWNPGDPVLYDGANVSEFVRVKNMTGSSMTFARNFENYTAWPGTSPESAQAAIDSMNAGFNYVFHVGHGFRFNMHCADDNVLIPDADGLTNTNRFFNLFMLNCTAVAYHFDCLGEHFLENPAGGAVSVLGANETAFADVAAHYMDGFAGRIFADGKTRVGQAYHDSRLARTPVALLADNADYWTHFIYTALSDPALTLWTGPVDSLEVVHPDTLDVGTNAITVTVLDEGLPVDSALVCLLKDGEDYQTQPTDGAGMAAFQFACESPGEVSVVVTGPNHGRYQGTISVGATTSSYLNVSSVGVDDDNSGGTFGNGDGVIASGESIDLLPVMINTGGSGTPAATTTLSTSSPWVAVITPAVAVPAITAGDSASATSPWRIAISSAAPDGAVAEFTVVTQDGIDTFTDTFARVLHAPVLEFLVMRVDDSPGNNNGVIENGEDFLLFAELKNYGSAVAVDVDAVLTSLDGGTTISNGMDTWPDLSPLAAAENASGFLLSEASVLIENRLELVVTDLFGHVWRDTVELRPPAAPSGITFDASFGSETLQVQWGQSVSPDVNRYHLYRSTSQGGPYVRATIDPVLHSVFTDTGLSPNTRYYYTVTAIDSSGNESALSVEASASTNPPIAAGWPNLLTLESANSPSIGNLDDDGDLEIVIGNDFLYVFHHDGQEARDGDGEPLTWGVFTTEGQDFFGPAALAKIDGDTGLEIIAAAYTSKLVYVFDGDGNVLPGWPRPTIDNVRAGTVAGDIDGDGSPEVIAIDQDAYLYVWRANGTEFMDGDSNPGTDGVFRRLPDTPWWQVQTPSVADLDGDGDEEILVAAQDSTLHVFEDDGSYAPGWPRQLADFAGGGLAIGDIDNDGDLEIICPVKNAGEVRALHHDNTQMWIRWIPQNIFFNPSPALADLNDDGYLETILPSSNGKLYVFDHMGNDWPGWPVTYNGGSWTESSPVVADLTGNGVPDILLGDESKLVNAWDASGNLLDGFPLVTRDAMRGTPSIADLDADGTVEIIAAGFDRLVYVWDLAAAHSPAAEEWSMFHGNIHQNGVYGAVIPTAAGPGSTPRVNTTTLAQNYPNPFNPTTTIEFTVGTGAARRVTLTVYDVRGARVRTLFDGSLRAGVYHQVWDGINDQGQRVGSGIYFYRLADSGSTAQTRKMLLLK